MAVQDEVVDPGCFTLVLEPQVVQKHEPLFGLGPSERVLHVEAGVGDGSALGVTAPKLVGLF